MLERDVENHLIKRIKQLGGKAFKWSSPNNRGVPDRICFMPGRTVYVECKAPGKHPSPLQKKVIRILRNMGNEVLVIDTKEKVDVLYYALKEELDATE